MSNITTWLCVDETTIDKEHRKYFYATHFCDRSEQEAFLSFIEKEGYKMSSDIAHANYAGYVLDKDKKDICPIVAKDFPMIIFAASGCSHTQRVTAIGGFERWRSLLQDDLPNVEVHPPSRPPRYFVATDLLDNRPLRELLQQVAFTYGFKWPGGGTAVEQPEGAYALYFDAMEKSITHSLKQFVDEIKEQKGYAKGYMHPSDCLFTSEDRISKFRTWCMNRGIKCKDEIFNQPTKKEEPSVEVHQPPKKEPVVMSNDTTTPPSNPFAGMVDYITAEVVKKIGDNISEEKLTRVVNDIMAKQHNRVMITINDKRTNTVTDIKEPVHRAMVEVIGVLKAGCWCAVVGPSGGGKTLGAIQYAKAANIKHICLKQMNQMLMPHDLLGFIDAAGRYNKGAWTDAIIGKRWNVEAPGIMPDCDNPGDEPALIGADEMDNANANIIMVVKGLATGMVAMPYGLQKINPNLQVMATMNTWGTGATREYVGRMAQDAALLNEFQFVEWDYDKDFEWELLQATFNSYGDSQTEYKLDDMMRLHAMFVSMREKAERNKIRVIISTRNLINVAKMLLSNPGWSIHQALKKSVYKGLKDEEWKRIEAPEHWKASTPVKPTTTTWHKPPPKEDGSPF